MDTDSQEHLCSIRSPFRRDLNPAGANTAAASAKCATGEGGGSAGTSGPSAPSRLHSVETLGPESGSPVLDGISGSAGNRASPGGMHHGDSVECSVRGQGVEPSGYPGCESDAGPGEDSPGSGKRDGGGDATLFDGGGDVEGLTNAAPFDSSHTDTRAHDQWTHGTTPEESASPPPAGPAPSASCGATSHEYDGFPESGNGGKSPDGGIANGQGGKKQKRRAERAEVPGERQRERCGSTAGARQGHGRAGKKGQQRKGGRPRTLEAFLQLCGQHVWTGGSTLVNTIVLLAAVVGELIETAALSLVSEGAALRRRLPRYCALARAAADSARRLAVRWSRRAGALVVALSCAASAVVLTAALLSLRVLRKATLGFVLPALERLPGYAALCGWLLRVQPWKVVGVAWQAASAVVRRTYTVCRLGEAWMFCRQRLGGGVGADKQEQWRSSGTTGRAQATGGSREPAGEVVERLLALAGATEEEMDPYAVLGLDADVSESELRRAYRRLAVMVHPDKCQHPRAEEAFKVLRAAWDILSDPTRKQQHDMKRAEQSEMSRAMDEFLVRLHEDLKEAMNTMSCTHCNGKHRRYEVERSPWEARYCARCNARHSASEGDFWAESRMLGFKVTFFAFVDGCIYDVTEWAACQQIPIPADAHSVAYHMSLGQNGRTRRPARPPSPGHNEESRREFQDFINRLFKDTQDRRRGQGGAAGSAGTPPPTRGPPPRPARSPTDPTGAFSSGPRPGPTTPGATASSASSSAQQESDSQKRRRKVYKKMPKRAGL